MESTCCIIVKSGFGVYDKKCHPQMTERGGCREKLRITSLIPDPALNDSGIRCKLSSLFLDQFDAGDR